MATAAATRELTGDTARGQPGAGVSAGTIHRVTQWIDHIGQWSSIVHRTVVNQTDSLPTVSPQTLARAGLGSRPHGDPLQRAKEIVPSPWGFIVKLKVAALHRTRCCLAVSAALVALSIAPAFADPAQATDDETVLAGQDAPQAGAARSSAATDIAAVQVQGQRVEGELTVELEQFGNQVQVVTSDDIAAGGYTNFAEIAQGMIRGANIGYSPDEGEYTIRLDGGGDRDTLVTLDGMPLYDRGPGIEEIWGATLIDPHMIDTVEVFRGGQSLYFGSNAGIGLVNIVTKKPDGTRKGEFGISYGSYDTRDFWGNYSFPLDKAGRHSVMFYGSRQASQGPQLFSEESQPDNHLAAGGITDYSTARGSTGVKYLWQIDETSSLNADLMYVESRFQDTFPNTTIYGPTRVRMPAFNLQYNKDWSSRLTTDITASYRKPTLYNTKFVPQVCRNPAGCPRPSNPGIVTPFGDWTGGFDPLAGRGIGDASLAGGFEELVVTALNRFTFNPSVSFVLGLQSINYRDTSDPRINIDDDVVSNNAIIADLLLNPSFSPNTSISLAGRVDFEDSFGSETIGKFGLRHEFDGGFYVRANGGTSFSLPKTNELFFNSETVVGNPDLKPEETQTLNYGVGLQRTVNGGYLAVDLGGFSTDITNRIQTTQGLTPNTRFNNDALTEIRGLVADVEYQFTDNLNASLSYTRMEAQLEGSDVQINATPEWFATGRVRYSSDSGRWHFNLLPRWQGPETIQAPAVSGLPELNYGDWFVLDGSVQYWLGDDRQHRLQLRGVNLLDEEYGNRGAFGNQFYGSAFIRGEYTNRDPDYFYPYVFQGKGRSFFVSYSYQF